jgi:Spy/CpxP family protein refolding chaperone
MKKNQYMLATAILAGGLTFASTGQAQQQPGKGKARPGQGQTRPGQGKAGPGQGQRPGQGNRPQRGSGGFSRRNSYEGIGLSEAQQAKITAIQEKQSAELRELFQELRDGGGDRQALGAKMTALREKYQKQTDAILTEEQKKKMAEARAQRGQGGRGQGQSRPGGFSRSNPFAPLGLKEEQQKKLDTARQEMSTQMRALFTDRDTPREERSAKMAKIREAYEATIKKVLTEEQMKKYQASRSAQGGRGRSLASLNLTEEQQKKVTALQAANRTAMQELFRSGNRETMREKMTDLRAKYDKQLEALLTDEQKKKYKQLQSQRPQRRPDGGSTRPGGGRQRPDGKSKERPKRSDA